jgi:hypothetical protein
MTWQEALSALGVLGGLGSIATLVLLWPRVRKLRADTRAVDSSAAIAEDAAVDARWRLLVEAQTLNLLRPMQEELARQGQQIVDLERRLDALSAKYWSAIGWIRGVLSWIRVWHADAQPPPPTVPTEIQPDV